MSVWSVISCTLLSGVCAFTLASAAGCGTDAKGIDECREIEQARCSAALSCGTVSDVPECKRFYRDQCLHGLAVASPGTAALKACVATIQAAGSCAMADASTALDHCENVSVSAPRAKKACDIVANPEYAEECSFLLPTAAAGGSSEGGSSGADDTSGAGGA